MPDTRESSPTDPSSIRRGGDVDDQITVTVTTPAPGQAVIEVGGEVDMLTSPQLRGVVLAKLDEGAGIELVVLSLDSVTFLGTSGLAVLIEVREAAHKAGVELRLACTGRRVLRPLTIAGLIPMFDIHDTVEQALEAT
ncbi:STAS domain-containing protein [Pseudonocardia bannensis]|uniref:Anti-sigma factor antagonist n=1 Tax=Pseudonocardia bannensis TaxID=630973 RepID=A0A848DPB7_9PSEU|nr:STAS domain-containing protein [Pseudonocardia bannensis]NMH94286.1 STAS domain-containing protein [Pseudonocardia bannensis]